MKRQEIFDLAVKHAKKMKKSCVDDGVCVYRGINGQMCLIGAMIKDEHYSTDLERNNAARDVVIKALKKSGILHKGKIPYSTKNFLRNLQMTHDCIDKSNSPQEFKALIHSRLKGFAELNKLKFNW